MKLWLAIYRRLDRLQSGTWFRIVASIIALAACVVYFGSVIKAGASLRSQRAALREALLDQNYTQKDEHALTFKDSGTVTLNGRTYGGEKLKEKAELYFDAQGNLAGDFVTELLLDDVRPTYAPDFLIEQGDTTWLLTFIAVAWFMLIIWLSITLPFILTLLATAVPVLICWNPWRWWGDFSSEQGMLAFAGIGLLTFTFILLTRAVMALFTFPVQPLAVAHTVIKEAGRLRISLVFIVALLIILPLLPTTIPMIGIGDPDSPLRFRIQSFISRSLGLTFGLSACMTLFLSCATVAFEIRDRQIWQLMSKPLSRINYLIGKWIGVMSVNLVIMLVSGVSIFTFIQYMRTLPVAPGREGYEDAMAVQNEILTAREGSRPTYDVLEGEALRRRVDERINNDEKLSQQGDLPPNVRRKIVEEVQGEYQMRQRSILPGEDHKFVFAGLSAAKRVYAPISLRYRFHILRSDEHEKYPVAFVFNGDMNKTWQGEYIPTITHTLSLSPELIRDDGTLELTIVNMYRETEDEHSKAQGALNFEPHGLELMYKTGNFEGNFLRAVLVAWVKLAFLAMLGIACATFLSFPVACLASFTVFFAGALGPFLTRSVADYYPPETSMMDWSNLGLVIQWAFQSFIKLVASIMVFLLGSFGTYRPEELLVEGRAIAWEKVGGAMLRLGVLWTGLALGVGYVFFRKRELATYSGQG